MHLIINDEQDKHLLPKNLLNLVEKNLMLMAKLENIEAKKEVGLIIVDDEVIKEINRAYRKIDEVTDVLSFALDEGEEILNIKGMEDNMIGDIYISIDRALEQSERYGHGIERELCFLALHGLLHLAGYDHQTEEDEAVMNSKIEKVLLENNLAR